MQNVYYYIIQAHTYNLHVRQTATPEKEAEEDMKFSLTNLLPWYSLKLSWITTVCYCSAVDVCMFHIQCEH